MGFTAKNLTKLQPKTHVFSTDYKSPTGSKQTNSEIGNKLMEEFTFFQKFREVFESSFGRSPTGRAIRCNLFA
jgi:hypothetical protein